MTCEYWKNCSEYSPGNPKCRSTGYKCPIYNKISLDKEQRSDTEKGRHKESLLDIIKNIKVK